MSVSGYSRKDQCTVSVEPGGRSGGGLVGNDNSKRRKRVEGVAPDSLDVEPGGTKTVGIFAGLLLIGN
jgi:hypothetical protein